MTKVRAIQVFANDRFFLTNYENFPESLSPAALLNIYRNENTTTTFTPGWNIIRFNSESL
jgi:hypothetical protein